MKKIDREIEEGQERNPEKNVTLHSANICVYFFLSAPPAHTLSGPLPRPWGCQVTPKGGKGVNERENVGPQNKH